VLKEIPVENNLNFMYLYKNIINLNACCNTYVFLFNSSALH